MSTPNYTDEMVTTISKEYQQNPSRETVEELAEKFNKTVRSVIAKLSAEGVYVKPATTNKRGEPVVRKGEFVTAIQNSLGVELTSLEKMTKADLQVLMAACMMSK